MAAEMDVPFLGKIPLDPQNDVMNGSPTKRIAIPTYRGKLCAHFGHCEAFTVLDIDIEAMKVTSSQTLTPPEHAPGVYPRWVKELGADTVIAGGMGSRAQALFEEQGIEVVVGADAGDPEQIALDYVQGRLATGDNVCDH